MYGPGLCKWRDKKHQSRNRTSAHYLTDRDGTTLPLAAWADLTGQNRSPETSSKSCALASTSLT